MDLGKLALVLLMSVTSLVAFLHSTYTYFQHLVHLVFFIMTAGMIKQKHEFVWAVWEEYHQAVNTIFELAAIHEYNQ